MSPRLFSRSAISVFIGLLFFAFAALTTVFSDTHLLPSCFGALGILSMTVGAYQALFRIEYDSGRFIAHPGPRKYAIADIATWKVREDPDEAPGRMRYMEVRFDRWYRRYFVFEADITPHAFDDLVKSLRARKRA